MITWKTTINWRICVCMYGKVQELNRQLACRDDRVGELMAVQDVAKQEAEQHRELVTMLQQRVAECETRHSGLETTVGHAEQQLTALQQEHADARRHVLQLEAQIRLPPHNC